MFALSSPRARLVLASALVAASGWLAVRGASAAPPSRWSDPATWNGGALPRAGDTVTIRPGKTVLLDVDPPRLAKLIVDGRLIVEDRDLRLHAGSIDVRGSFAAGSASRPFAHRAEIVLDGASEDAGAMGISGGGRVELHGEPKLPWTHLASTAAAGSRELTLASEVDWEPGDHLALAPTGFDAHEAEEVVVAAVDGARVSLAAPLRFAHWGAVTDGIDERAEIGLLTHNVVVRGESAAAARGDGGQVVVMEGGRLRISDVELAEMGQRAKLGRYPIHFHLAGDASGSFVTASSIHHSFNRCLTIHGTSGVRVTENVAYDAVGHCYFLEDGAETGNLLDGNLGMLTRGALPGQAILASDVQPATFWIANPDNALTHNAAAGSDGSGFWYNLTPHPTGPSASAVVWPRHTNLRAFAGNVAHTNEMNGLFVDNLRNPPGVVEAPNYSPGIVADYRELTAYKNRRRGAWLRGTNLRLTGAHVADNSIGVTFAGAGAVLRDSLIVGETENQTGPPKPVDPGFPIRGFEFYDGRVGVERTRFVNFAPNAQRMASALGALQYSPFFTDPGNYASALTFENALPVYLKPYPVPTNDRMGADGYRSNVFRDVDGSVSGTPGASVVLATPFLLGAGCVVHADWNAAACEAPYGSLFVNDLDAAPRRPGPLRVTLLEGGPSLLLLGNPRDGVNTSFQTNLRAGARYGVRFGGAFPRHLRISLHHLAGGGSVTVILPQAPPDAVVYGDRERRTRLPAQRDRAGNLSVQLVSKGEGDASAVYDICAGEHCD